MDRADAENTGYAYPVFIFLLMIVCLGIFYFDEDLWFKEGIRAGDVWRGDAAEENISDHKESLVRLIKYRIAFISAFDQEYDLLRFYENGKYAYTIKNDSGDVVRVDGSGIFYDISRISKEIAINENDSSAKKAEKIFNFVRNRYKHLLPLYKNEELYHSPRFFSVYGGGLCDNAASNMAFLARFYGFEAGRWFLSGHVVAAVKYDGKWHIYDPDALGIVYCGGEVADIDGMVELAEQNKLGNYNDIYRTISDNRFSVNNGFLSMPPEDPYMQFMPGETRYFYDRAFMLTTDAFYLQGELKDPRKFNEEYAGTMANYVRQIPLNNNTVKDGKITVTDYFPFAGVFICLSKPGEFGEILFDSGIMKKDMWMPSMMVRIPGLHDSYLTLTAGIKNLEKNPSYSITIRKLDKLLEEHRNAKLLTVHYYSYPNAKFDADTLKSVKKTGLVWEHGK